MARPLTWLAETGIKNSSGSALAGGLLRFYTPGTTVQTAVYSDAEQTSILTQPVVCDTYGTATVYTEGPVDLAAYDSEGSLVRTISRANAQDATEVEIENDFLTGVLASGSTGAGGRTTLDAFVTSVGSSVGGMDSQYKDPSGGTERALNVVISERGLSVKDKGAIGNGSAVDTAAFKSAIAAIKSAGGKYLIIPPGTYLVDDELVVDFSGLNIIGAGKDVSIIKSTSTSKNLIRVVGLYSFSVDNLGLACTGTSTEAGLYIDTCTPVQINRLAISGFQDGLTVTGGSYRVRVYSCDFTIPDNSSGGFIVNGGSDITLIDNSFTHVVAGQGIGIWVKAAGGIILMCRNMFGTLATGFKVDSASLSTDFELISNYMAVCTNAIDIGPTGVVRWSHHGNRFGTAGVIDASDWSLASATTLSLDLRPYYNISGAVTINHIVKTGIPLGYMITLQFAGAPTVTHSAGAAPAGTAAILLSGAANFVASANDTLTLMWNGTAWIEVARTVI